MKNSNNICYVTVIDDRFSLKNHVNSAWSKIDRQNDRELEEMVFTEIESLVVYCNNWWLFYLQTSCMLEAEQTEWQRIEKKVVHKSRKPGSWLQWLMIILSSSIT